MSARTPTSPRATSGSERGRSDSSSAIHRNCGETADAFGMPGNYVAGANIAGFVKVADSMIEQGVV